MKTQGKIAGAALAAALLLAGCGRGIKAEDIAGRVYCYEKDGFGGDFTIRLEEDGSFTYYEGGLSSYIGNGDWSLEEDVLTLQERTRHFCFRVAEKGEELVFQAEPSGDFTYLKVADGERFSVIEN